MDQGARVAKNMPLLRSLIERAAGVAINMALLTELCHAFLLHRFFAGLSCDPNLLLAKD